MLPDFPLSADQSPVVRSVPPFTHFTRHHRCPKIGLCGTPGESDHDLRFFSLRGSGLVSKYYHRQTNKAPSVCVTLETQARRDNVPIQIEGVFVCTNINTKQLIMLQRSHGWPDGWHRMAGSPVQSTLLGQSVESVINVLIAIDSVAPGVIYAKPVMPEQTHTVPPRQYLCIHPVA